MSEMFDPHWEAEILSGAPQDVGEVREVNEPSDEFSLSFSPESQGLADITAGAADREHEPARPDDLDRLRARRDAEVLRAAADEIDSGPTFPLPPSVLSALLRERADRIEGDQP